MSTQVCRLLVLAMRSACCRPGNRPCVRPQVSLRCGPMAQIPQRRSYSLDSLSSGPGGPQVHQSRGDRLSPSSALPHRRLSAAAMSVKDHHSPQRRYDDLDLGSVEENTLKAKTCNTVRRFLVEPDLANLVAQHMGPNLEDSKAVIFDCHPGPGVLTRTLLNAGAQRVVALEPQRCFLPDLRALESKLDGQLDVIQCDFFNLDPLTVVTQRSMVRKADKLFSDLGISEAKWTDEPSVRMVGIMPHMTEKNKMWRLVYFLLERQSIFHYGRIELNLLMSEREYLKLLARPGDMENYRGIGALWQMACNIQLLHKEPWSSFVTSSKSIHVKKSRLPNQHMCLVRLTPREDLFSAHLSPSNSSTLIMMVKQCLTKRKALLMDKLNLWSPESGPKLLSQMGMPEDILTGHVYPHEYRQLFELMEESQEFTQSWLYQEVLDNTEESWS
ncbi:dimethyladenosine transferase 2, mitochondrial [Osmerus eperlanus]|uniref:dimethyladenosine transferase 2, mitochondrial n=1 Tax=Osmerus eperlanus TaxID=29151 RepID=UPI002E14DC9D